jgi:hypothetical protein
MANEEIVSEFDKLFAEIVTSTPEVAVAEITDPGDEPSQVPPPVLKMEAVLPVQRVEVTPAAKPDRYREVDGKIHVEGGPVDTTVYPKGYVQFKWSQTWNKCALYLEDVIALRDFFRDEERYADWEMGAVAAGLKYRNQPKGS